MFESRRFGGLLDLGIITRFGLGRRNISDRLQQAAIVEPVHPFERRVLDRNRRLAKGFEATIESAVAWIFVASVK